MQLPAALLESLQKLQGFDEKAFTELHRSGEQITSVRINNKKKFDKQYSFFNAELEQVPWCSTGFYLPNRPSFTLDPLFHAGAYYVQEASSMFLEQALKQAADLTKPLKVLDLCAAPGGKSTLVQSLISAESLLVSNEVIKTRVNVLTENITKWGAGNVIVTNNDPRDFHRLETGFDVIIVDAPCSGSGLFRKDPDAITEWSENNVLLCSQRQQRILADILPSLNEGGVLLYSTCSYSVEEDEAIADWLMENDQLLPVQLQLEDDWGITETISARHKAYGYRFYPDKVKGEGFYLCAFIKKERSVGPLRVRERTQAKKNKKPGGATPAEIETLKPFLKDPNVFFYTRHNDELIALPKHLENDLASLQSSLYIKKAGIVLGTVIRDELIPAHELALSNILGEEVRSIDADRENALQYLRRGEINIRTDVKGWALFSYGHLPLGWVKVLPNRINNYYPAGWRILNK